MNRRGAKKDDFEDDGHAVAPMDAPELSGGMLEQAGWFGRFRRPAGAPEKPKPDAARTASELTPSETRSAIGGALAAVLCIAGVFAVCAALFIWFCTNVWLR